MRFRPLIAMCLFMGLAAQELRQLPDWAAKAAQSAAGEAEPPEADAWVLLDRTEMAYTGEGEVRTRRFRLVKVLSERGLGEAVYAIGSLGGRSSKVKQLKAWNLRPDGDLIKLDTDSAVILDDDRPSEISTSLLTTTKLPRVVTGSLLAFESLESTRHPMGPTAVAMPMQPHPVRRWELEVAASGGWFTDLRHVVVRMDVRHLAPWVPSPEIIQGKSLKISGLPALPKAEGAGPSPRNTLPSVLVRFQDPEFHGGPPTDTWNTLAAGVDARYQERFQPSRVMDVSNQGVKEALLAIHAWMVRELTYKQVYITPERGWLPDPGPEVVRHRYGDCKDLTCCLLSEAKGMGLEVHPVMALIGHGFIEEDEEPSFTSFDHVISAIALKESLGFPAEVVTSGGRFLLVDPTSRFTPLGLLPAVHRNRRVMICTPRGAQWVRVPAAAVQVPVARITIEGEVDAGRSVVAQLSIEEVGESLGLRGAFATQGNKALQDLLAQWLDLPPTASLVLQSQGDPWDLSNPFRVGATLRQPGALRREGQDDVLPAWGMPGVPPSIQSSHRVRRFPVESNRLGRLELQATYRLPYALRPVLPFLDITTAFRTLHWKAQAQVQGGLPVVQLHLDQSLEPAFFDASHRDKGVASWKEDRAQLLRIWNDGLACSLVK